MTKLTRLDRSQTQANSLKNRGFLLPVLPFNRWQYKYAKSPIRGSMCASQTIRSRGRTQIKSAAPKFRITTTSFYAKERTFYLAGCLTHFC